MRTRGVLCGLLLMLLVTTAALYAQADRQQPRGQITGQVIDSADKTVIDIVKSLSEGMTKEYDDDDTLILKKDATKTLSGFRNTYQQAAFVTPL